MTYGFEIEGYFPRDIQNALKMKLRERMSWCMDGSVQRLTDGEYATLSKRWDGIYQGNEIRLGIFNSKARLLSIMKRVMRRYYGGEHKGCGVHLHIRGDRALHATIRTKAVLDAMWREVYDGSCTHAKIRMDMNRYCRTYNGEVEYMKQELEEYEKYRWMRNHPQGTLEFRYLAPCEHLVENVKKLLAVVSAHKGEELHAGANEKMPRNGRNKELFLSPIFYGSTVTLSL